MSFEAKTEPPLSLAEMEALCQPSYNVPENASPLKRLASVRAKKLKRDTSFRIALAYEYGSHETTPDRWLAAKYKKDAGLELGSDNPENSSLSILRSENLYFAHGTLVTGPRLFILRLARILRFFGYVFLPTFFSVFGLSYGVNLVLDLWMVLKTTFDPQLTIKELEDNEGFFQRTYNRFIKVMKKGNRPYRMIINDAVWFTVNLITFILISPILSAALNTVGFVIDVFNETALSRDSRDIVLHNKLIRKLNTEIEELEKRLATFEAKKTVENKTTIKSTCKIKQKIETLKFIRDEIKSKRYELIRRRIWIISSTVLVLVAMLLIYFCPPAFLAAAILAFIAGSILTGLGRRLYLWADQYVRKLWNWLFPEVVLAPAPKHDLKIFSPKCKHDVFFEPEQTTLESQKKQRLINLREDSYVPPFVSKEIYVLPKPKKIKPIPLPISSPPFLMETFKEPNPFKIKAPMKKTLPISEKFILSILKKLEKAHKNTHHRIKKKSHVNPLASEKSNSLLRKSNGGTFYSPRLHRRSLSWHKVFALRISQENLQHHKKTTEENPASTPSTRPTTPAG